jgi:uncharacterized RDD family membrane protein YckC
VMSTSKTSDLDHILQGLLSLIPEHALVSTLIGATIVTLIQIALIANFGQTIGKMLLKIKIVDIETGQKANFVRSVVLRSILFKYIGYLLTNFLLLMVDFVFLFTKNNRTLHDRLAKTIVVNAESVKVEKKVKLDKPR